MKKQITENHVSFPELAILLILGILLMFCFQIMWREHNEAKNPKFNITKIECHNELEMIDFYNCIRTECEKEGGICENCTGIFQKKEVCEDKEVEEISIPNRGGTRDCPRGQPYSENCIYYQEVFISKKDISQEWLDKNCFFLKFCDPKDVQTCVNKEWRCGDYKVAKA